MDTKCAVCNQGGGYVLCDGCGMPVCFNCFRFLNSRRLCASCVSEWEKKRSWQAYAEQYANMTPDEKAGIWATLTPEERVMLEGELGATGNLHTHHLVGVRKYTWLAFPVLGCLIVLFLVTDQQAWKKATVASKKLGSELGTLADSVRREVVDLTGKARTPAVPLRQPGPIELVGQNLRSNGLPVTAGNLRMKTNPVGEGTIVYSPRYFGPNRRLAWIVIDGQAYSLSSASQDVTPTLRTSRAAPSTLWKKTGLSHEKALSQLKSSLWE